jgi:hypothetical protein
MITALVGLVGILLGGIINEYFRRKNRVELYSREVFQNRLKVYEKLYDKINKSFAVANDVIESPSYSIEQRREVWGSVVLDMAAFTDANGLYLNEDVVVHCMTSLIGVEDIYDVKDPKERRRQQQQFYENYGNAKEMIKKESGLKALDNLFSSISKAKHRSEYIDLYRDMERKFRDRKERERAL